MARTPRGPNTAAETAARLKSLNLAKAPALRTTTAKITMQPKSPMTAAQAARLSSVHSALRTFRGR